MNIFKLIFISITLLFSELTTVQAAYQKIVQDNAVKDNVATVSIYFSGRINRRTGIDLIRAIDDVRINYKNTKNIYLYIDSYGGDYDTGKMAYWVIKNASVAVTTINMGTVEASAGMVYCGGKNRLAMPGADFIMEPPFKFGDEAGAKFRIQQNVVYDYRREVGRYVGMLRDVYKDCSNYTNEDLEPVLYTLDKTLILTPEKAIEKGITKAITDKFVQASVSYYITE